MNNILVTPSFAPDFERCKAMLESSAEYVTGASEHLLLVDRGDMRLFHQLQNERVRVVCKDEVLPIGLYQLPFQKRWWLTSCSLPVRGWILQQIMKLAIARDSNADAIIFADSDLMFIKELDMNELWQGNQLRFFRTERRPHLYKDQRYKNWYDFGCNALDLGNPEQQSGAYITQLATMRPKLATMLCNRLEEKFSKPWYQALLNTWDFSEYVLYGVYVEELIKTFGEKGCGHFLSDEELCHSSWFYDIHSANDVEQFISKLAPKHFAVHLQSNLCFNPATLSNAVQSMG